MRCSTGTFSACTVSASTIPSGSMRWRSSKRFTACDDGWRRRPGSDLFRAPDRGRLRSPGAVAASARRPIAGPGFSRVFGGNRRPSAFRGDRAIADERLLQARDIRAAAAAGVPSPRRDRCSAPPSMSALDEIGLLGLQRPHRLQRARIEAAARQMREVAEKRRRGLARRAPAPARRKSSRSSGRILRSALGTARAGSPWSSAASQHLRELAVPARRTITVNPDQLVVLILVKTPHLIDEPRPFGGRHLRARDDGARALCPRRATAARRSAAAARIPSAAGSCAPLLARGRERDETHERECMDSCTRTVSCGRAVQESYALCTVGRQVLH